MSVTRKWKILTAIAVVGGILIGLRGSWAVYAEKSCLATYGVSRKELHEKTVLMTATEAETYKEFLKEWTRCTKLDKEGKLTDKESQFLFGMTLKELDEATKGYSPQQVSIKKASLRTDQYMKKTFPMAFRSSKPVINYHRKPQTVKQGEKEQ